eukprot:12888983-Prorocentrum_lima.AAC.1
MGIPVLGGNERFTLLVQMISKLEKKHSQLSYRVSIVKYSMGGKNSFPGNCKTSGRSDHGKLRLLEVDEKAAENRRPSWR